MKYYVARKYSDWEIEETDILRETPQMVILNNGRKFKKITEYEIYAPTLDEIKKLVVERINQELDRIERSMIRLSELKENLTNRKVELLKIKNISFQKEKKNK